MPCMHAACRSCVLDYLQVRYFFNISCQVAHANIGRRTNYELNVCLCILRSAMIKARVGSVRFAGKAPLLRTI
jgi:hypothetical protein